MHYGIIGAGPVGSIFASHLHKSGHTVSVLENDIVKVNFLRKHPLTISGKLNAKVQIDRWYTNSGSFVSARPDVILISTKGCYSKEVLQEINSCHPRKNCVFVSCQNGINVEEHISDIFGEDRMMRAILNMGCNFISLSEVSVSFHFEHFLSDKKLPNGLEQVICHDWNKAGLTTKLTKNYKEEAFKKAILVTALGAPCAIIHLTMSEAMAVQDIPRMVKEIVREGIKIGMALGYSMGPDFLDDAMSYLSMAGSHKPSILMDIENKKRTENDYHAGQLFRCAEKLGLEVPVIQTIYYLINNIERSSVEYSYGQK